MIGSRAVTDPAHGILPLHREGVTAADAAALLGHTVEVHLSTYLPHSGASGIVSAAQALGRAAAAE